MQGQLETETYIMHVAKSLSRSLRLSVCILKADSFEHAYESLSSNGQLTYIPKTHIKVKLQYQHQNYIYVPNIMLSGRSDSKI